MSLRATSVNLIRYQWFVFRIVLRFWLQEKKLKRYAALKHVGSSHQPDEEGLDSDVKDSLQNQRGHFKI